MRSVSCSTWYGRLLNLHCDVILITGHASLVYLHRTCYGGSFSKVKKKQIKKSFFKISTNM